MPEENPTWGYTRIQGALKNVGHCVGRSTIAPVLKAHGLPPVPQRPTSWQTFLHAHWGAIAGADFCTTEVWTWRGLNHWLPERVPTARYDYLRTTGPRSPATASIVLANELVDLVDDAAGLLWRPLAGSVYRLLLRVRNTVSASRSASVISVLRNGGITLTP